MFPYKNLFFSRSTFEQGKLELGIESLNQKTEVYSLRIWNKSQENKKNLYTILRSSSASNREVSR